MLINDYQNALLLSVVDRSGRRNLAKTNSNLVRHYTGCCHEDIQPIRAGFEWHGDVLSTPTSKRQIKTEKLQFDGPQADIMGHTVGATVQQVLIIISYYYS